MTFEEYHEINRKYGCKIMLFDIDLNKFTKEEYEKKINRVWNQIFEDDSKKEQEKIEKELRKKQNASLRKLKRMVKIKKETDEFVRKLKEQEQ